jgi:hypothetical protein
LLLWWIGWIVTGRKIANVKVDTSPKGVATISPSFNLRQAAQAIYAVSWQLQLPLFASKPLYLIFVLVTLGPKSPKVMSKKGVVCPSAAFDRIGSVIFGTLTICSNVIWRLSLAKQRTNAKGHNILN